MTTLSETITAPDGTERAQVFYVPMASVRPWRMPAAFAERIADRWELKASALRCSPVMSLADAGRTVARHEAYFGGAL